MVMNWCSCWLLVMKTRVLIMVELEEPGVELGRYLFLRRILRKGCGKKLS